MSARPLPRSLVPAASALLLMAGCTAVPRSAPPPERAVAVATPAPPAPAAAPLTADWRDWPLTPGTWSYSRDARGSVALYGVAGTDAALTLRCDLAARRMFLSRASGRATPVTIRTTSTTRTVPVQPTGGAPSYVAAALTPRDPLLDAIGFSRGRFTVEQAGAAPLVVPAWAELERVTQDCRG